MKHLKVSIYTLEFVVLSIYITSKLLWDQIPYLFELFFYGLMLWGAISCLYHSFIHRTNMRIILFVVLFSGYVLINAFFQDTPEMIIRAVYEYIIYMAVMFFFIRIRSKINLKKCLVPLAYWGTIISLLTWVEYFTKSYLITDLSSLETVLYGGIHNFRATVFSRSFLTQGTVLGVFSVISLYVWYEKKRIRFLLMGIFSYASILATGSRGPLVAFFIGLCFFPFADAFYIRKSLSARIKFILSACVCIILVLVILNLETDPSESAISYFIYRIQNIFNWSGDAGNAGRIYFWKNSIENWFKTHVLFGIGPSQTGAWGDNTVGVTESGVLKRLCELGIVGFFMFYSFVFCIIRKSMKVREISLKREMLFWLTLITSILVNDMILQSTEDIMVSFWLWCSLGAIAYLKKEDKTYSERRNYTAKRNIVCENAAQTSNTAASDL